MKIIKSSMRVWITLASLGSFIFAWALFGHSNKPLPLQFNLPSITAQSQASVQTLRAIDANRQSQSFPFSQQNQAFWSRPRLRTGGS
jgi:hypothetical protein